MYDDPWYWIVLPNRNPISHKNKHSGISYDDNHAPSPTPFDDVQSHMATSSFDIITDHLSNIYTYLQQLQDHHDHVIDWINYQQVLIKSYGIRLDYIENILNISPPPPPRIKKNKALSIRSSTRIRSAKKSHNKTSKNNQSTQTLSDNHITNMEEWQHIDPEYKELEIT